MIKFSKTQILIIITFSTLSFMRVYGFKHEFFQAIAHFFTAFMFAGWYWNRGVVDGCGAYPYIVNPQKSFKSAFFLTIALWLTAIEVVCATADFFSRHNVNDIK